jgi:hypothetical protein
MAIISKASTCRAICVTVVAVALSLGATEYQAQQTPSAMSVTQQNALVQKYCAVCHDDVHKNGGLSLQHFDAARVDPSLAAMMVSKLNTGALGASGLAKPDDATQRGLLDALTAKSRGADEWAVTQSRDPRTNAPVVTASILRKASSRYEFYRLKVTCRIDSRDGEIQLTWSPHPADSVRAMSVATDDGPPLTFKVEGRESMGNGLKKADGSDVTMGPAAAILYETLPSAGAANLSLPLPVRTLTISNLFPNETIVFPFDKLTPSVCREMAPCFTTRGIER